MKKNPLLSVFVCFVYLLFGWDVFAQTPVPTVTTPVYYCQGSTAIALTATTTDSSATLRWYDALTGGTEFSSVPIPSVAAVGNTSYYVTQTIGGVESTPRSRIEVSVLADNGSPILSLRCDPTQILAADRYSSVFFDWTNTPSLPNQYTYSYTVNGGPAVNGTTGLSNLQVFGLTQGQSVTLSVAHTIYPCDLSVVTCVVPCATLAQSTFNQIASICTGDTPPVLPLISLEGFTGTWSPAVIDNARTQTYVFTPNSNQCARAQTMTIAVNPNSPGFSSYTICSGNSVPNLNTISPSGVTGIWSPAIVDNFNSGSYTFTPDLGQCAAPQTIDVTVALSNQLIDFRWTVSEAFSENQIITISAMGQEGDYLYKLDDGLFQTNPVFEYVSSGQHSVTVMDQTGCSRSITKSNIMVVNYPKYFTPNNDGFNDYWNITGLSSQSHAFIRIFDRYGKMLRQISPNGLGWNGIYNGYLMPADDYWFVVNYQENNVVKEFRSHFSLKR